LIIEKKVWGTTECLLQLPMIQVHRINFVRGGTCRLHYHASRYNAFYVLEGRLEVARAHGQTIVIHTRNRLEEGDIHVVPPGVVHQFTGISDGVALELYFPGEVDAHDIVRLTQGFLAQ
jgi:quercetin dioxygenase-like cupin family protein